VLISMGESATEPLVEAVVDRIVRAGAFPQVQFSSEVLRHSFLQHGTEEQIAWVPEMEIAGMDWADVYIALRGAAPLHIHADISARRLAVNQAAHGTVSAHRWQSTRWVLVRVPDEGMAHAAGVGYASLLDEFFAASLIDWSHEAPKWSKVTERLNRSSSIRLVGDGTDLSFETAGRTWVTSPGAINIPDGEIMTAPVENTAHGTITFENPAVFGGRLIHNLRLSWTNGRLTDIYSSDSQEYVEGVVSTDDGASQIGEFAIGINPSLHTVVNDILLDEKIAGTCHIALGRAYPVCGGVNQSAIHWDIVKDLRHSGTIYADGEAIFANGALLER
jgi:aminopeptidase